MKTITPELMARMRQTYENDRMAQAMTAAMAKTDIADVAFLPMQAARLNGEFEIEIKTHGITAQEQSGRCWLFAAMNVSRESVIRRCKLKEFELSGNYLAFWDKLEKANNFLEQIIDTADLPAGSREVYTLVDHVIGDGGSWPEYVELIKKYGCVPKTAMPESRQSGYTANLLAKFKRLLRKDAAELRRIAAAGEDPSARKEEMLVEFYKAECIAFGEPVERFDFCYRDEDDNYHAQLDMTPQSFYETYIGTDLDEYVYISCQPSEKKPYYTHWAMHESGCMIDHNLDFLNLPMDEVEELILKQMRDGEPVWFGCDSRQYGERQKGYWDPLSFDYEALLGGVDLTMSREDQLLYREAEATHAMLLIGVNFDTEGKPNRWKIENSWGTSWGQNGYFVCSEEYMQNFVFEAVINKKHLTEEQLVLLGTEPVILKPWEI